MPVTQISISKLDLYLSTLFRDPGALKEVVLLTPRQHHAQIRQIVQSLMSKTNTEVEVVIRLWPASVAQEIILFQAAQQVVTDWVLLLDEDAFTDFPATVLDVLLLKQKPRFPSATGPRGIEFNRDGITCVVPSSSSRTATFLVPPMVLPTMLIPPVVPSVPGFNVWYILGDYISRSELDVTGGLVIGHSNLSSNDWCSRYVPRRLDGTPMQIYTGQDWIAQQEGNVRVGDEGIAGRSSQTHVHDLPYVYPIACALLHKGNTVSLVVQGGTVQELPASTCDLQVHSSSLDLVVSTSGLPSGVDIIILCIPADVAPQLSSALRGRYPSAVIVNVPPKDLPYTDWMATLEFAEWKHWHVPEVQLSVITNNRPDSLRRLLSSLSSAKYFGDKVNLRINLEQTADFETLLIVNEYSWNFGDVFLHHRIVHGGLLTAVVESWYPHGNDSYALILEDDVELSPLFYAYLKLSLLHYRYGKPDDRSSHLFGISLYQQKNLELHPAGRHLFNARSVFDEARLPRPDSPYLSQIPCSWGALYFPEHWREFHAYLATRLAGDVWPIQQTIVPDVRSNKWTRSWKKYFIELVYLRGYVMLYPNYAEYISLSTNHLEVGSHVKDVPAEVYQRKKLLFNLPLMPLPSADNVTRPPDTGLLELPGGHLPSWAELPVLDLLGKIVDEKTIMLRGAERRMELTGCQRAALQAHDVRELLCID
ncbi:hypothetical protein BD414DRAFT_559120 [Trametes punicea]|nr:hypothetical protein BD414DRAFT_559120 [Trametes punicea]